MIMVPSRAKAKLYKLWSHVIVGRRVGRSFHEAGREWRSEVRTDVVGDGAPVAEAAGGPAGAEVDAVRGEIGASESGQEVVVAVVDERVSEDEHARV
ncbi:hypothetical protein Mapa_013047 [Marchantia paleacea]|nr:hypothetical protein Mapa_013047 [Marchantia paleacea]